MRALTTHQEHRQNSCPWADLPKPWDPKSSETTNDFSKLQTLHTGEGMSPDKVTFGDRLEGWMVPPRLSRADAEFAAEGLEFVATRAGISIPELNDLFEKVHVVGVDAQIDNHDFSDRS
jgi:hypothetical protein